MTHDLLNDILNTFKTHCNAPELRAKTLVFGGEVLITILAPQPTEAMHELARDLESEFDELGHRVVIQVRQPASGIGGWLTSWGHRMLGMRMI
jgi:hypothetical protein